MQFIRNILNFLQGRSSKQTAIVNNPEPTQVFPEDEEIDVQVQSVHPHNILDADAFECINVVELA